MVLPVGLVLIIRGCVLREGSEEEKRRVLTGFNTEQDCS
jgi:hypothetical protein